MLDVRCPGFSRLPRWHRHLACLFSELVVGCSMFDVGCFHPLGAPASRRLFSPVFLHLPDTPIRRSLGEGGFDVWGSTQLSTLNLQLPISNGLFTPMPGFCITCVTIPTRVAGIGICRRQRPARAEPPGGRRVNICVVASTIQRTTDAYSRLLHHVRVDLCRAHILMSEQFLHRPNIIAILQKMRRERMPQRVAACPLVNPRHRHRRLHHPLHTRLI